MRISEPSPLMTDLNQCKIYDETLSDSKFGKDELDEYVNLYEKFIGITSGKVIDLGSGSCNFIIALSKKFANLTFVCYDNSETMLKIAQGKIEKENLSHRIRIVKDDVFDAFGNYDVVLSNRLLHNIESTDLFWKKIDVLGKNIFVVDVKRYDTNSQLTDFIKKISPYFHPSYIIDTENSFKSAYSYYEVKEQIKDYNYNLIEMDFNPLSDILYSKLIVYKNSLL